MDQSKKRVLIIEDEIDICKSLAYRLEKAGYDVSVAYDGEEGLRQVRFSKPDVILLDLMLPFLPGEQVCKAIREDFDTSIQSIPIIMLTAKTCETDKIIGRVIGANTYLTKPYDFEKLLEEIQKYGDA